MPPGGPGASTQGGQAPGEAGASEDLLPDFCHCCQTPIPIPSGGRGGGREGTGQEGTIRSKEATDQPAGKQDGLRGLISIWEGNSNNGGEVAGWAGSTCPTPLPGQMLTREVAP